MYYSRCSNDQHRAGQLHLGGSFWTHSPSETCCLSVPFLVFGVFFHVMRSWHHLSMITMTANYITNIAILLQIRFTEFCYIFESLNVRRLINSVQRSQYHGYWWQGSLCRLDISAHDIDYVEWKSSCLTWGRIPATRVDVNAEEWHEM